MLQCKRRCTMHSKPPSKTQLQKLDLNIALAIAGFAGLETRDRRGNLSADVWVRHSDKQSIGKLLEAADLKQLLMEQLRQQLSSQKDLLNECEEADVGVNWILDFTQTWESKYLAKINQNFDIAQRIVTAMHDAFFEIQAVLRDTPYDPEVVRNFVEDALSKCASPLPPHEALVRFYYRNPYLGPHLQRVAGKILQKKEVCNKAGGYSAKVQRNDITQERDMAMRDFIYYVENSPEYANFETMLQDANLHDWLEQHWTADSNDDSD